MKQIKMYLRKVSPLNDMKEMTTTLYICKKMLTFFFLYAVAAILGEVIIIGGLYVLGYDPLHGIMPTGNMGRLLPYYGFSIFLFVAIVYCRVVEKRNLQSMGFNKRITDYLLGSIIAIVLLAVIMVVCCLTDTIVYAGINHNIDGAYIFALLIGLMIQSMAEEALCRGFLLQALLKRTTNPVAIVLSSTAFVFPHCLSLFETDIIYAFIGIINLYLISAIFSLLVLSRSNIWLSCGLHSIWNFVLYGIFGLTLSGADTNKSGVLCFGIDSYNIINGGEYGIESSIVTTIILSVVVAMLIRCWNTGRE